MPRDIPIGNGTLLVNFDNLYQLRDLYWPHVGQENHTSGHIFRFGVWIDGRFEWVSGDGWHRTLNYADHTLVTQVTLEHEGFGLRLECADTVDFHENLYIRRIIVHNNEDKPHEVRLFFAQDFHIYGNSVGDTAYYEPERKAVFHYKGQRWFLINTARETADGWELGVDQWAVGQKEMDGKEGTWRDAEDGQLSGNPVVQGSVDSALGLHLNVPAHGQTTGWYWIAVGTDFVEVTRINRAVRQKGPDEFIRRTHSYWALWSKNRDGGYANLKAPIQELYRRSLLILRTQIDNGGAIIAANDYDVVTFNRDTYSYVWPRDGALVASALIEAGYRDVPQRFFNFCRRAITNEGYLLHKYTPDGALASSWHSWYADGHKQLPVQEDETALVLWALWRHFARFRDVEFIKPLYRRLIINAAEWLADYCDTETGLPLPSWDLWEERRGVLSWTVGAVWGGLQAGANFATAFGEQETARRYHKVADQMRAATDKYLWREDLGHFARMINRSGNDWEIDRVLDASVMGLWYFGMYAPDDPKITATMQAVRDRLWVKTDVGGVARYENDYYHQVSTDLANVPGNPWFICTLWLAQWHIATATTRANLKAASEILDWCAAHALTSGVMAEQVHPYTNAPLSVSPLTWSHATLVATVHEYMDRWAALAK